MFKCEFTVASNGYLERRIGEERTAGLGLIGTEWHACCCALVAKCCEPFFRRHEEQMLAIRQVLDVKAEEGVQ